MGVCYTIILMDEFDWAYVGTNKEKRIEEFKKEYAGYTCELIAQWYGTAVFDVDKNFPLTEERVKLIKKYSDTAYYIADNNLVRIIEIE